MKQPEASPSHVLDALIEGAAGLADRTAGAAEAIDPRCGDGARNRDVLSLRRHDLRPLHPAGVFATGGRE